MKNPIRDLPRTIHLSMATTVGLYLLINVSYFIVLPVTTVASSNTVVLDYGVQLFGTIGATVFSVIVAISCFGSLNAGFYTSTQRIHGWLGSAHGTDGSSQPRASSTRPPRSTSCRAFSRTSRSDGRPRTERSSSRRL